LMNRKYYEEEMFGMMIMKMEKVIEEENII
jgi:hypothetical protein